MVSFIFSRLKTNVRLFLFGFLCLNGCDIQKQDNESEIDNSRAYFDTKISRPLSELRSYAKEMALKRPQLKLASEVPALREYYSKAKDRLYKKDFEAAEIMFLGMAEQGYADAQTYLSGFYIGNHDEPVALRDTEKSAYWLEKAMNSGYTVAQYDHALSFYVGNFHDENWGKYAEWSYIAAEQGHAKAQDTLGGLYLTERGVEKDLIESYKWFSLAIARYQLPKEGEEISKGSPLNITLWSRDLLISREGMTTEQVKEAKRRAIEWEKSHPYAYPPINKDTNIEWKDIDLASDAIKALEEQKLNETIKADN